jgi:hypothetical protein
VLHPEPACPAFGAGCELAGTGDVTAVPTRLGPPPPRPGLERGEPEAGLERGRPRVVQIRVVMSADGCE